MTPLVHTVPHDHETAPPTHPPPRPAGVPAQLRLDERTRRVGLAGVAQARAVLAESRRRRLAQEEAAAEARRPPGQPALGARSRIAWPWSRGASGMIASDDVVTPLSK